MINKRVSIIKVRHQQSLMFLRHHLQRRQASWQRYSTEEHPRMITMISFPSSRQMEQRQGPAVPVMPVLAPIHSFIWKRWRLVFFHWTSRELPSLSLNTEHEQYFLRMISLIVTFLRQCDASSERSQAVERFLELESPVGLAQKVFFIPMSWQLRFISKIKSRTESLWYSRSQYCSCYLNLSIELPISTSSRLQLSIAYLKDRNLPKNCARATPASLPEGNSSPQSRSMMNSYQSSLRLAEVPYMKEACLWILTLHSRMLMRQQLTILITVKAVISLVRLAISLFQCMFLCRRVSPELDITLQAWAVSFYGAFSVSSFRILHFSLFLPSKSQLCQYNVFLLGLYSFFGLWLPKTGNFQSLMVCFLMRKVDRFILAVVCLPLFSNFFGELVVLT